MSILPNMVIIGFDSSPCIVDIHHITIFIVSLSPLKSMTVTYSYMYTVYIYRYVHMYIAYVYTCRAIHLRWHRFHLPNRQGNAWAWCPHCSLCYIIHWLPVKTRSSEVVTKLKDKPADLELQNCLHHSDGGPMKPRIHLTEWQQRLHGKPTVAARSWASQI